MKNLLIGSLSILAITLSSFVLVNNPSEATINQNITIENSSVCKHGQCKATAKSTGNRCKHCVSNAGDSYCWQHR